MVTEVNDEIEIDDMLPQTTACDGRVYDITCGSVHIENLGRY